MDALEKLDLLEEHADLVTQLQGGDVDPIDKLDMLERLTEIIELLGSSAEPQQDPNLSLRWGNVTDVVAKKIQGDDYYEVRFGEPNERGYYDNELVKKSEFAEYYKRTYISTQDYQAKIQAEQDAKDKAEQDYQNKLKNEQDQKNKDFGMVMHWAESKGYKPFQTEKLIANLSKKSRYGEWGVMTLNAFVEKVIATGGNVKQSHDQINKKDFYEVIINPNVIPDADKYFWYLNKTAFDYANYLIGIGYGSTTDQNMDNGQDDNLSPIDLEQLASLVQLQGKVELNSLSTDLPYKELSKSIKKVFDEHLKNTDVYCQPLSTAVALRNSSAKHILNNGATRDKMLLTLKCAALLSTADSSVELELNTDKPNITAAYLVKTHIELNGKSEKVGLIVQKDDKGEFLYDAYIEIAGKVSGKNKKDLGVPTGEESYDSSFPVLPKSLTDNLSNDNHNVNPMFDKAEIGNGELIINIFFEDEFNDFEEKTEPMESSDPISEPTELTQLLADLQEERIQPDDIDLDHLAELAANSDENDTLDQIRNILDMELVAKWHQQLDEMVA